MVRFRYSRIGTDAPSGRTPTRRAQGFTLVELMITLAVAAILLTIAIPSFRSITLSNELTTTANDVVSALNTARTEAIKRNANAQVCSNVADSTDDLSTACGTATGAVYLMTGGSATPIRSAVDGIKGRIQLSGNLTAIRFGGSGLGHAVGSTAPYDEDVVDICTDALGSDNHRIVSMSTGSVVTVRTETGDCP